MLRKTKLYVGGAWIEPSTSTTIDVIDSTNEAPFASIPDAGPADVDRAVAAAAAAFPDWSRTPVADRAGALRRIGEGLTARADELVDVVVREVGMQAKLARLLQVNLAVGDLLSTADAAAEFPWEEEVGTSVIVREPVGVVGCITPWNYPLHQVTAKIGPALAAGCTVVLKPSEVAPLTAFVLAEVIDSVGLPPGVFNLVSGTGPVVGEALASHPGVDMISFTGSTRAGRRVAELGAASVKRVALELGGKSPDVLLDDLDDEQLVKAVRDALNKCFLNSGQSCNAMSRLLVPRNRLAQVEQAAADGAARFTVGDPFEDATRLGPLASAAQQARVEGYLARGLEEGARLVTGGPGRPEGLEQGFYVRPTIFSDVAPGATIAQEEIFGPVLSIIPYDTDDDAVAIANDTIYGLAAAVWSADPDRALAVARRIRAGQIDINGGAFNPVAPFGGFKQSGLGREQGRFGLEEFVEIKSLQR